MATEIEAYIERLDALRGEVADVVREMDTEELNWTPTPNDTNSPAAIVAHIAGSETFWIHHVVGDTEIHRDREAEFQTRVAAATDLVGLLGKAGEASREVLLKTSEADLASAKTARPGEGPVSLRYAIVHQIEHMAQHLGHLTLTRQLYQASQT